MCAIIYVYIVSRIIQNEGYMCMVILLCVLFFKDIFVSFVGIQKDEETENVVPKNIQGILYIIKLLV